MKAPDKIYLLKVELEERWPGITEVSELEPKKEECYIRKDALLELIKDQLKENAKLREADPDELLFKGKEVAMQTLIDKIESL